MAITAQNSTQAAIFADPSLGRIEPTDSGALRLARFDFVQDGAGDANSTAALVRMPAGKVRIIGPLSRVAFSALGTSRTLDVGRTAATKLDGDELAADDDAFAAAIAAATAGSAALTGEVRVETRDGFTLEAKVKGGTIPNAATLSGYVAYLMG